MREVGVGEARRKFGRLLHLVEQGGEVTITRYGKPIARLAPVGALHSREQGRAAILRIRERAEAQKLGPFDWAEWKFWRDEGRAG